MSNSKVCVRTRKRKDSSVNLGILAFQTIGENHDDHSSLGLRILLVISPWTLDISH